MDDIGSSLVLANAFLSKGSRKRAAAKAAHTRDLEKLVQLVTAHLGARRGSSSVNTLLAYRKGIRAFLEFIGGETRVEIVQVDDESIQGFRNSLLERGLKAATVNLYLAAVSELFAALRWAGVTSNDPLEGVARATPEIDPQDRYRALSLKEVARLLEAPDQIHPANASRAARDRALLGLGFQAGLRIHEIVGLRKTDFHRSSKTQPSGRVNGQNRLSHSRIFHMFNPNAQGTEIKASSARNQYPEQCQPPTKPSHRKPQQKPPAKTYPHFKLTASTMATQAMSNSKRTLRSSGKIAN